MSVASHTKSRATRAEMADRKSRLRELVAEGQPMSVRHAYYRAVVDGLVPKTEAGYAKVQRALATMRLEGEIPFPWITDNTRWMRKTDTYSDLGDMLAQAAQLYRRDLWSRANVRVECWCESDSIAGVIFEATDEWAVPLMPVKGFSSITFARSAAMEMNHVGMPVEIFYVGDHDPAGLDIERNLRQYLTEWLTVPLNFTRLGVTWDQVEELDLPGTTPKKSYGFPMAVEAEALPAPLLRELVHDAIAQHVDPHELEILQIAEEEERGILTQLVRAIS